MSKKSVDRWGVPLMTADEEASEHFCDGVDALASLDGDPLAGALQALEADPEFILARCMAAEVKLYAMTGQSREEAMKILDCASPDTVNGDVRTALHHQTVLAWAKGDLRGAIRSLEDLLLLYPRDLLAAKVVQDLYLFVGDSVNLRDSVNRIYFSWPENLAGYSHILGMRSFGLEENYCFEEASILARRALSMHPRNVYARHSMAHVYEMLGERNEGVQYLLASVDNWSGSPSNVHMWWHLSLYHIDQASYEDAKRVYDESLLRTRPVTMHDVGDRAACLWRLHLLGEDVSERAVDLSSDADPYLGDGVNVFNEFHLVIAELLAGKPSVALDVIDSMVERIGNGYDSRTVEEVAVPFCRALMFFSEGDFLAAARLASSVRHRAFEFGGSHAQRDIVFQTALVSAAAGGDESLTRSLRSERMLTRPNSQEPTDRLVAAGRERGMKA